MDGDAAIQAMPVSGACAATRVSGKLVRPRGCSERLPIELQSCVAAPRAMRREPPVEWNPFAQLRPAHTDVNGLASLRVLFHCRGGFEVTTWNVNLLP